MDEIGPTDLKSILHSKRANIYYLQHCRVLVNGGRVEYVTDQGKQSLYWNIPIANTTTVLLGTGTSVTQAAMRELAKAGVLVGFCGGGGTPLFSANEVDIEVAIGSLAEVRRFALGFPRRQLHVDTPERFHASADGGIQRRTRIVFDGARQCGTQNAAHLLLHRLPVPRRSQA